jgi:hypothetical protein
MDEPADRNAPVGDALSIRSLMVVFNCRASRILKLPIQPEFPFSLSNHSIS